MRTAFKRVIDVLSSLKLTVLMLVLLGLLTWLGTLEQVHTGLHEVQKKYFESFFLVHDFGPVSVPLPGANLVLSVLFVSIVVGGMVRLRKKAATAGILVAHIGIAVLLVSGYVKMHYSEDGHVTLYEGQRSNSFQSYYRWEISVARELGDGRIEEHVLAQEGFAGAEPGESVTFSSAELPFSLRVDHFMPNCRPMPKGPMFEVDVPVVDGVFLRDEPLAKEAEMNTAGAYVSVLDESGTVAGEGVLWGRDMHPWTVGSAQQFWTVDLRKERYPMPFTIALTDFTKEDHPRTGMPKWFSSDVEVFEGPSERSVTISMNEPLRSEGLVLYQASWGPSNARPGDPLFSTLAVVRNPADQWPLIGCIIIALGLVFHFSRKLTRWMRRETSGARRTAETGGTAAGPSPTARRAAGAATVALLVSMLSTGTAAQDDHDHDHAAAGEHRHWAWSDSALETAASLPLQDGGRIKPLSSYAGFTLLRINGKRSVKISDDERLTPIAWLFDVLVFPGVASGYETFMIQDSAVAEAIGVSITDKKKRDRYSLDELRPAISRLFQLAGEYDAIPEKDRSSVQLQVVMLANNVFSHLQLERHLDFARYALPIGTSPRLAAVFGSGPVSFTDVVENADKLRGLQMALSADAAPEARAELADVSRLVQAASEVVGESQALALIPPTKSVEDQEEWITPAGLLNQALSGQPAAPEQIAILRGIEDLVGQSDDLAAVEGALRAMHGPAASLATARGEYEKIGLEITYYKMGLIRWSLTLFVLAFLTAAFLWLRPRGRFLHMATSGLVLVATIALSIAIAQRCVIRGRPPVSTLYETVLFVTATGALIALFLEAVNRQRIAISAAAALGAMGLFVANGYEMLDKQDTMPSLVAVLDTNFWLSTHVTSITIGYSAGMLAALLGTVYLLAKALGIKRTDREFYRNLGRMTYGVLAFGLIFSLVGTILGGIWANESWGRFWGWDPKENGALLICIAMTAILHARMGGYLREHGIAMAAAFTGTIVAFSWWGVNLLGVGLHSYGFTSGIHTALWTYYGVQWAVVGLGAWVWFRERAATARSIPASVRAEEPEPGPASA